MIYKFKSKASGDVLMMGPNGDAFLRVLGREPAAKGILEPAQMAAALAAIEQAVAQDEAARQQAQQEAEIDGRKLSGEAISLRQRLWPMVDMIQRSNAEEVPIVWGT